MKKIGRLDRFASANPVSHVVYHAIPESPTGCELGTMLLGEGGPPRCAAKGMVVKTMIARAIAKQCFMVIRINLLGLKVCYCLWIGEISPHFGSSPTRDGIEMRTKV